MLDGTVKVKDDSADRTNEIGTVKVNDADTAPAMKNTKATKASSKGTTASISSKGSKADDLKAEKATKASSKATKASISSKGTTAHNINNNENGVTAINGMELSSGAPKVNDADTADDGDLVSHDNKVTPMGAGFPRSVTVSIAGNAGNFQQFLRARRERRSCSASLHPEPLLIHTYRPRRGYGPCASSWHPS